MYNSDFHSCR